MIKRLPLQNLNLCILRRRIIGEPIFNQRLCSGIPGIFKEFENSFEKCTAYFYQQ